MMGAEQTRIIAVANEKGGVGKTVTAINLGAALSLEGKKILIIDVDPQGNATKGLGVVVDEKMLNVYDIISDYVSVRDAIVATRWKGLDLIPSHIDLSGADVELADVIGRENRLKNAVENITGKYDFILIDTPPSLSLLTVNVLACAREVLVPCQTHPYAYDALEELFDTVFAIKKEINPEIEVAGIVATFFDGRTRVSHGVMEQLRGKKQYRSLLFDTVIRLNTTIAESAAAGKPVVFFRRSSYGSSDYIQLAREVLKLGSV